MILDQFLLFCILVRSFLNDSWHLAILANPHILLPTLMNYSTEEAVLVLIFVERTE